MSTVPFLRCERCLRNIPAGERCGRHPGATLLDPSQGGDRDWLESLQAVRQEQRRRWLLLVGGLGGYGVAVGVMALFLTAVGWVSLWGLSIMTLSLAYGATLFVALTALGWLVSQAFALRRTRAEAVDPVLTQTAPPAALPVAEVLEGEAIEARRRREAHRTPRDRGQARVKAGMLVG